MSNTLLLCIVAAFFGTLGVSQTYTMSTFACGALPINIPGTSANLGTHAPFAVAVDPSGNVFFVDQSPILRLDATTGLLKLAAGNGTPATARPRGKVT
jgi:hypothetical protein